MTPSPELELEIDSDHEHGGGIACRLTWDGRRHPLKASDVFSPFPLLLHLARAILTQRLPYEFFWDEEGFGATFEALPLAPDSPAFHLRVTHEREAEPWIDAEVDRQQIVRALFEPLQDFVRHAGPPSRMDWGLTATAIAQFQELLANPVALRSDIHTPQWVRFSFADGGEMKMSMQWLHLHLWNDFPACTWALPDSDPFWGGWLAFLRQIASQQLPAEFKCIDHNSVRNMDYGSEAGDAEWGELKPLPYRLLRADPVAHPGHFRLRLTETHFWRHPDYLLLDEVLDNCAFVGAFCTALEIFFRSYEAVPDESGDVFDLRTLPWAELQALL